MPAAETAPLVAHLRAGNRQAKMRIMRWRPVKRSGLGLRCSGALLGLLFCGTVLAATAQAHEISVQEAVAQAQHETDGKVLSVQTLNVGKRKVYRIKLLTRDGQVRVVQVPAEQ
jgi:hypothetical protein